MIDSLLFFEKRAIYQCQDTNYVMYNNQPYHRGYKLGFIVGIEIEVKVLLINTFD